MEGVEFVDAWMDGNADKACSELKVAFPEPERAGRDRRHAKNGMGVLEFRDSYRHRLRGSLPAKDPTEARLRLSSAFRALLKGDRDVVPKA
jgi:hypothetical protein